MLKAAYCRYFLAFKQPATTSRSTMRVKETYFVKVWDDTDPMRFGIGECAVFRGLSSDDIPDYDRQLTSVCRYIHAINIDDIPYSSMRFGFESAMTQLNGRETDFPEPITINGLIWMGSEEEMTARVEEKLSKGFRCLKLKIGGIDWDRELNILRTIRQRFTPCELEIRLDANEAFTPQTAHSRLEQLAPYSIHSIEQPIRRGQIKELTKLCQDTPIPIALDEELIGITDIQHKRRLLAAAKPQYIILKPSLCGGFTQADEWVKIAEEFGIGWWATSALESNVGLDAIARWVSRYKLTMPQGLGTGQLYRNNIPSPLVIEGENLGYNPEAHWDYSDLVFTIPTQKNASGHAIS